MHLYSQLYTTRNFRRATREGLTRAVSDGGRATEEPWPNAAHLGRGVAVCDARIYQFLGDLFLEQLKAVEAFNCSKLLQI